MDVICLRDAGEKASEEIDGIHVYRVPLTRNRNRGMLLQLLEYLAFVLMAAGCLAYLQWSRRYRTVQVHNLPDFLVVAAVIPKLAGAQVILDLHDLMPEFFAARTGKSMDSLGVRFLKAEEKLSTRFADHVITVTDEWRETLIERGLDPSKVSVVMNLPDDDIFHLREKPEAGAGPIQLWYHGTFADRYGLDLAVKAVGSISSQKHQLHLRLHGDGETRAELQDLVRALGLDERVSITSTTLSAEELAQEIADNADIALVPNRRDPFTDGILPTKLMEYAALGVPTAAARTPAIAAYFDDDMVEFFEPGNVDDLRRAITRLIEDPEHRRLLAQAARRFTRAHNWSDQAKSYVALVQRTRDGS